MTNSGDQVLGDEERVRAAVPDAVLKKMPGEKSHWSVWGVVRGRGTWLTSQHRFADPLCAWEKALRHPSVVAFEARSKGEPTENFPKSAHEWLEDALGRFQVTHVHSSVREALKVMNATTENDTEPASPSAVQGEPQLDPPLEEMLAIMDEQSKSCVNLPVNAIFMQTLIRVVRKQLASLPPEAPQQAHATICESCGGDGTLGVAEDGRLISCEACGGHEDSLGLGYIVTKATVPEAPEGAKPCPNCGRSDGWHKAEGHPPSPSGDCRKIVWLENSEGMAYWGVRAYQSTGQDIGWCRNGEIESDTVTFWMEGPHNPYYPLVISVREAGK